MSSSSLEGRLNQHSAPFSRGVKKYRRRLKGAMNEATSREDAERRAREKGPKKTRNKDPYQPDVDPTTAQPEQIIKKLDIGWTIKKGGGISSKFIAEKDGRGFRFRLNAETFHSAVQEVMELHQRSDLRRKRGVLDA